MRKTILIISLSLNGIAALLIVGRQAYRAYFAKYGEYYYHQTRRSMHDVLPVDSSDIIFIGDSIVEGLPVTELFGRHVKNRGIGNNRTNHVLQRIRTLPRCRKLFISVGINDITAGAALSRILVNYDSIITYAKADQIYVSAVLPTRGIHAIHRNRIINLNRKLIGLCRQRSVYFIDAHTRLSEDGILKSEYTIDGVHLNGTGYMVLMKIVSEFL